MDERALRGLIAEVHAGRLGRRRFVGALAGLGLGAPLAAQLLGPAPGHAQAPAPGPPRRGGGGPLRILYWQAPTILNPHLAVGVKDVAGARIFYEPLADFDAEGQLVPVLAAGVPSAQNGGIARDGTSVTWPLKRGVVWHDGKPFTADDVVFTWEYAADPATAATSFGLYRDLDRVEKVNKWARSNNLRWRSDEYDRVWKSAEREMDPVKRAAMLIRLNDIVVHANAVIPIVWRNEATAVANRLRGVDIAPWGSNLWNLSTWHR